MGGDTTSTTTTMTGGQEVHARTHRPQKPALDGDAKSKTGCGRLLVLAPVGFGFALDPRRADEEALSSSRPAVGSPPRNRNPTVCTVACAVVCIGGITHSLLAIAHRYGRPRSCGCTARATALPASSLGSPIKLSPAGPAGAQTHSHTVTLLMRLTVPVPPAEPTYPLLQPTPANPASRPRRLPVPA